MLTACKQTQEFPIEHNDVLLAEIENKKLYLSDINGLIPDNSTSDDSTRIINAFSENWAKEVVILLNAEKTVSKNINLDKLVKNYRESLLINNFEKQYIEAKLDTVITEKELESFYNKHKSGFIANEPYLQFWFVKVSAKKPGLDKFYEKWKSKDLTNVQSYCEKYAENFELSNNAYVPLSRVKQFFPEKLLKKINFAKIKSYQTNLDEYEYFFKIKKIIKTGEPEPKSSVYNNMVKLILHQRRAEVLERLRESLYEDALKKNQIKFYNH